MIDFGGQPPSSQALDVENFGRLDAVISNAPISTPSPSTSLEWMTSAAY